MVAQQPPGQAVFDHPGGAVRALDALAAGAAQGQRGIAAAVEEQQGLLARHEISLQFGDQRRAEPVAAVGRRAAQVDRGDLGQLGAAEAGGQDQRLVAAALDLHAGLDGGGRGGEDDGDVLQLRAHHGDVAGVVVDALLLLETGLVRLVDDDQPEVGERQEQGGARADEHLRLAAGRRAPDPAALVRLEVGVPGDGRAAEARGEAVEPRCGQRDFRHQHQHLPPGAKGCRDRLEIDLGLAGSRDAVEQRRGEGPGVDIGDEGVRGVGLRRFERGGVEAGVGLRQRRVGADLQAFERAARDKPAHHGVGDLPPAGEVSDRALPPGDIVERGAALRGQAGGRRAGRAELDERLAARQRRRHRQRHAQHGGGRRDVIVGDPLDQPAHRRGQRPHRQDGGDGAQLGVGHVLGGEPLRLPHDAGDLARPERHLDDIAGHEAQPVRHRIVERAEAVLENEDADPGLHRGEIGRTGPNLHRHCPHPCCHPRAGGDP